MKGVIFKPYSPLPRGNMNNTTAALIKIRMLIILVVMEVIVFV